MTSIERPIVRDHRPDDEAALIGIIDLSFDSGIYSFFAKRSIRTAEKIIVIESEGRVIGFAEPRQVRIRKEDVGNILWLAVHPDFRRMGVASRLVDECVHYLEERAIRNIFISIEKDNFSSLALFEKKGFKRIPFNELAKEFGFRVISFYNRMLIAPHEAVLVRRADTIREPSSI